LPQTWKSEGQKIKAVKRLSNKSSIGLLIPEKIWRRANHPFALELILGRVVIELKKLEMSGKIDESITLSKENLDFRCDKSQITGLKKVQSKCLLIYSVNSFLKSALNRNYKRCMKFSE